MTKDPHHVFSHAPDPDRRDDRPHKRPGTSDHEWPVERFEPAPLEPPPTWYLIARRLVFVVIVALAIAIIIIALGGCGSSDNDVKVKTRDKTGAVVLNMPDQFPSVAVKCDGRGHRVYVTNRYDNGAGAAVTVIDDAKCTKVGP